MKLDKNSYGTIALVYSLSALAIAAMFVFTDILWLSVAVSLVLAWFCCWQTMFHCVPVREVSGSDKVVSSVSDGKVLSIGPAYEEEYLKRECLKVSIYMDFWDIHANFWPVNGEVTYYKYHPGKHFLAFKPKSSVDNEHTCTNITTDGGCDIFFKQIAGGFARRIVCYSASGLPVRAGEQCGIIKFGSRVEIFLPADSEIAVKPGDCVRASETIIAILKK